MAWFSEDVVSSRCLLPGVLSFGLTVEAQAVLGDHVQLPTEDAEGFAVDAVGVAWKDVRWIGRAHDYERPRIMMDVEVKTVRLTGCMNVWPSFMNLGVDGEGCRVDGFFADDDVAVFVYEDEVGDADLGEVF